MLHMLRNSWPFSQFGISKDEIKQYLDAHYVSSHEACWRLLEREIHTQEPAVMALTVHEKPEHPH
jgi:hypothetical protein